MGRHWIHPGGDGDGDGAAVPARLQARALDPTVPSAPPKGARAQAPAPHRIRPRHGRLRASLALVRSGPPAASCACWKGSMNISVA